MPAPSLLPGGSGLLLFKESATIEVSGFAMVPESVALVARWLWHAAITIHMPDMMSSFFMDSYLYKLQITTGVVLVFCGYACKA